MKKIIFRSFLLLIITLILIISYLSTIGIETKVFNKQIAEEIKKINKNLDIELKKIKIVLNPLNFNINAKTIGPEIRIKEKSVEIEKIQSQISIQALLDKNFSLSNLEVSTKSIQIKELISFIRELKKDPKLYILERLVKKGYLIADLNFEFDTNGKIKKNFEINGIIEDGELSFLKEYNISKLNFVFNLSNKNYIFKDLKLSLNDIIFTSEKINVENKTNHFFVEGEVKNENIEISSNDINLFLKFFEKKPNINKIDFNSQNDFSFKINDNFKISEFKILSKINVNNIIIQNNYLLKEFLPKIKDEITFAKQEMEIDYSPDKLNFKASGEIILQDKPDLIDIKIEKKKDLYEIISQYTIKDNPLIIDFLNYEKKKSLDTLISLKGKFSPNKKTIIKSLSLSEGKNQLEIEALILNKNSKIRSLEKIVMDYKDRDNQINKITIKKKNKDYTINGLFFNANNLIKNLVEDDDNKKLNIFENDFAIDIELDQVLLDNEHKVKKLKGNFYLENNDLKNANLNAFFSNNKFLKFTINSNHDGKVTTLFLDKAEPIVKRYKFIKGYEGGSLDFYSLKKGKKTNSTLKIYDFKLKELPALTKLLTLASLQGIADVLSGEGIRFNEFEMNFENQDKLMTIKEIYAIGPAISILMDGYVEKNKIISLRGTLVPATTLNKVIGSIPFLGKILVGSKSGEGVFGVSFKIKGPPKNLETTVNPIKTLTPRFITRTLEKIKKN